MLNLLKTNDAPSTADLAVIRMLLAEKEEEISIFRVEMNRLESKMETLATRRRAVRQIAKSYHALLSPFRRFPPELLSEIFLHCLPDALYPTPAYNAPLILCWVSQKWRQIALATPGLWTSPSTMVSLLKRPTSNPRCLPDLWLTRSQALPLDVRIYIDQGRSASKSVWDAYVSHVSRWKHLRLKYKRLPRHRPLPELPASGAPMLETVVLRLGSWEESEIDWGMQLLRSANRLRELTWAGPTDRLLTLSFTNLTSLTLSFSGVPTFHLLRILQLAVQLAAQAVLDRGGGHRGGGGFTPAWVARHFYQFGIS